MEDYFRMYARPLSSEQEELAKLIKLKAEQLLELFSKYEHSDARMLAIAKTNLEQAIMWGIKAIT